MPTGPVAAQEYNKWIGKMMRLIETIKPGLRRQDLDTLFHEDGGINPIDGQDRYVLKECSMIKIDVHFKQSDQKDTSDLNDPNDEIESVSRPYLQYPIMD